jgi:hypothetical protein
VAHRNPQKLNAATSNSMLNSSMRFRVDLSLILRTLPLCISQSRTLSPRSASAQLQLAAQRLLSAAWWVRRDQLRPHVNLNAGRSIELAQDNQVGCKAGLARPLALCETSATAKNCSPRQRCLLVKSPPPLCTDQTTRSLLFPMTLGLARMTLLVRLLFPKG